MPILVQELCGSGCGSEKPVHFPIEAGAPDSDAGHLALQDQMCPTDVVQRRGQGGIGTLSQGVCRC